MEQKTVTPDTDKQQRSHTGDTLSRSSVLARRYEILKVIGYGGMSTVYAARDLRFSSAIKLVAVKEMAQLGGSVQERERAVELFEREANLLASLSHPAIPKVFDFFPENKRAYLIIEFIDGQDLETVLSNSAELLPQEKVVRWAIQVCDVLNYLHTHEPKPIVFRDMKPSNVMLTRDDRIVLIDFGIAKIFQNVRKGTMIGTEGYAPPEQYRGLAEPRGDLYALGAMMHHLLSRTDPRLEPPFTFNERLPHLLNPTVQPPLENVIMKALSYLPEERFSTAVEMQDAMLASLGVGVGVARSTGALTSTAILTKVSAISSPSPANGPLLRWQYTTNDEVRATPSYSAARDLVVVGSYDKRVYALEAATGRLVWQFDTGRGVCATTLLTNDLAIVGSEDHNIYAIRLSTGALAWSVPTRSWVRSSACLMGDTIIVGTGDGSVLCLALETGREVWSFRTYQPVISSPAVGQGYVYVGCEDGVIHALDALTGVAKWKYQTLRAITSSPTVHDGLVIVGSMDSHLYAFDAQMGWPVWKFKTNHSISSSPRVRQGMAFVGSVDGNVYGVDIRSGKQAWRYAVGNQITSSPAVDDTAVYVGSNDGHMYSLDTRTGDFRWKYKADSPIPGSPTLANGQLFFGCNDFNIYCLNVS